MDYFHLVTSKRKKEIGQEQTWFCQKKSLIPRKSTYFFPTIWSTETQVTTFQTLFLNEVGFLQKNIEANKHQ